MQILVLYDGKSGHLSQALGAAKLIQSRSPYAIEIECSVAKPSLKIINKLLRQAAAIEDLFLSRVVVASYNWRPPSAIPDLIISFGGDVIALNAALRRMWGTNNIVIGNRYSIPIRNFCASITMAGDRSEPKAIASHIPLCKTDSIRSAELGWQFKNQFPKNIYWAMLVGGTGSGYQYSDMDWRSLAGAMLVLSNRFGIKWLVTTSRRSDPKAENILMQYLGRSACASACYYHAGAQPICIDTLLGASDRVFCTEDSLSMIAEAVGLEKPVVTLQPQSAEPKAVHGATMKNMSKNGLIERCLIETLEDYQPSNLKSVKPYQDYLDDIYDQLHSLVTKIGSRQPVYDLGESYSEMVPS